VMLGKNICGAVGRFEDNDDVEYSDRNRKGDRHCAPHCDALKMFEKKISYPFLTKPSPAYCTYPRSVLSTDSD
jgi:hypothetical protein